MYLIVNYGSERSCLHDGRVIPSRKITEVRLSSPHASLVHPPHTCSHTQENTYMYTHHIHTYIKRERSACLSVNGKIEFLTFLNHFLSLKIDENLSSMRFCSYFLKICRDFSPFNVFKIEA